MDLIGLPNVLLVGLFWWEIGFFQGCGFLDLYRNFTD
jgi:hypothetical protein